MIRGTKDRPPVSPWKGLSRPVVALKPHNMLYHQWHSYSVRIRQCFTPLMILGRLYLLLKGKLGIDTAVLVSDRYDVAHSKKQFERARWETIRDGIAASYKTSGKHTVPNYHKSLRHPRNKAAVAEFNSIYTHETAPKLLNDQSILLVGVFKIVHMQRAHNAAITGGRVHRKRLIPGCCYMK